METKVTRSPNFNCVHYIFEGIMILFMFIRLLVEIWQLLPSLWYCVQVYCHGGCMRNGSNEWNEGLPGFIGIGVREMALEAPVSNFSLPLLCKNGAH